jgi:putative resolvase
MDKLLKISESANLLGVSTSTLRRWERQKKLMPERTRGGQRRYRLSKIKPYAVRNSEISKNKKTLAYARVSSNDQKSDLERQKQMLEMYCASQG